MSINSLSQAISPTSAGIIWLTDEYLSYDLKGVYEFNYLLDGLLLKTIENDQNKPINTHFFLTSNFGKNFFISHLVVHKGQDLIQLGQHIEIARPLLSEQPDICIFNRSQNTASVNVLKELKTRYKEFEFRHLVL